MDEEYEDDHFGVGKENGEHLRLENRLRRRSNLCLQRSRPTSYPPCFSFGAFATPPFMKGALMDRKPQKLIEPVCEEVSGRIGRKVKFADEAGKQLASYIEIPNKLDRFGFRSLTNINSIFEDVIGKDINEIEQVFDTAFAMKNNLHQKTDSECKENTESALGCKRKYSAQSYVSFPKEKFPRAQASVCTERETENHTLGSMPHEGDCSLPQNIKIRKHSLDGCSLSETDEESYSCDIPSEAPELQSGLVSSHVSKSISPAHHILNLFPNKEGNLATASWQPGDCRKYHNGSKNDILTRTAGKAESIPCYKTACRQEIPILHQGKSSSLYTCQQTEKNASLQKSMGKTSEQIFEELIRKLNSAGQGSDSSSDNSDSVISKEVTGKDTPIPVFHNTHAHFSATNVKSSKLPEVNLVGGDSSDRNGWSVSGVSRTLSFEKPVIENSSRPEHLHKETPNEELSFTLVLDKENDIAELEPSSKATGVTVDYTLPFSSHSTDKCDKENSIMVSSFDENPNISFTIISPTPSSSDIRKCDPTDSHDFKTEKAENTSTDVQHNPDDECLANRLSNSKNDNDFISDTNSAIVDILSVFDEVSFPEFKHEPVNYCDLEQERTQENDLLSGVEPSCYNLENNPREAGNITGMLSVNQGSESGYGTHSFISDDFFNEDVLSVGTSGFELDDVFEGDSSDEIHLDPDKDSCKTLSENVQSDGKNKCANDISEYDTNANIRESTPKELGCNEPTEWGMSLKYGDASACNLNKELEDVNGVKKFNIHVEGKDYGPPFTGLSISENDCSRNSTAIGVMPNLSSSENSNRECLDETDTDETEPTSNAEHCVSTAGLHLNTDIYKSTATICERAPENIYNSSENSIESTCNMHHTLNGHSGSSNDNLNLNSSIVNCLEECSEYKACDRNLNHDTPQHDRKDKIDSMTLQFKEVSDDREQITDHEELATNQGNNLDKNTDEIIQDTTSLSDTTVLSDSCKEQPKADGFYKNNTIALSEENNSLAMGTELSLCQYLAETDCTSSLNPAVQSLKEEVADSSDMEFYMPKNIARTLVDCMFRKTGYQNTSDSDSSESSGNLRKMIDRERKTRRETYLAKRAKAPDRSYRKRPHHIHKVMVRDNNSGEESDIESFSSEGSPICSNIIPTLQFPTDQKRSLCEYSPINIVHNFSDEQDDGCMQSTSISSAEIAVNNCCYRLDKKGLPLACDSDQMGQSPSKNHSSSNYDDLHKVVSLPESPIKHNDEPSSNTTSKRSSLTEHSQSSHSEPSVSSSSRNSEHSNHLPFNIVRSQRCDISDENDILSVGCKHLSSETCGTIDISGEHTSNEKGLFVDGKRTCSEQCVNMTVLGKDQIAPSMCHLEEEDVGRPKDHDDAKLCESSKSLNNSPKVSGRKEVNIKQCHITQQSSRGKSSCDESGDTDLNCDSHSKRLLMEGPCSGSEPKNNHLNNTLRQETADTEQESQVGDTAHSQDLHEATLNQKVMASDNDLNITVIITSEGKLIVQDEER